MMAPPGLPAERLAVLRTAFETMLQRSRHSRTRSRSAISNIGPMSGAELQKLITDALTVSPEVIKHAIAMSRE